MPTSRTMCAILVSLSQEVHQTYGTASPMYVGHMCVCKDNFTDMEWEQRMRKGAKNRS